MTDHRSKGRAAETRSVLRQTALRLFCEQGYDNVPVTRLTQAAGVSHMTFFRHFPTKESVVVSDLFDPVIASAVAAQPSSLPPLQRAVLGLIDALDTEAGQAEVGSEEFLQRISLAATTPTLRGAVRAASQDTEDGIAEALTSTGAERLAARAAAAAVMGAATALLVDWAISVADPDAPQPDPAQVLRAGLRSLVR